MSAGEFAFLAIGLVLGLAAGAAVIYLVRARPPRPHEVRLTVTPDSIPRRARTTLAAADLAPATNEVIGVDGLPETAEPHSSSSSPNGRADTSAVGPIRTPVPEPSAEPPSDGRSGTGERAVPFILGPPLSASPNAAAGISLPAGMVGIEIRPDDDREEPVRVDLAVPVAAGRPGALRGGGRGAFHDDGSLASGRADAAGPGGIARGRAQLDAAGADGEVAAGTGLAAGDERREDAADPCAAERRTADERCATARRLGVLAENARGVLREAQLAADQAQTRATAAAARADPRGIRARKEAAQQTFRAARSGATTREDVESAARAWLQEINRINSDAREATLSRRREQDAANALLPTIERLSVEADAARISAEAAQEACLAARESLAGCEEETVRATREAASASPAREGNGRPTVPVAESPERNGSHAGRGAPRLIGEPGDAALYRLLRGDRSTMRRIVGELAGDDAAERRRWQLQLSDLVDALLARAIESSTLDFPAHHPFWGMFTRNESRDIVTALASLGYRFDGLGGFVDGRVPSQRDLSLAVGFAGLDPMRIRRWPTEAEMLALFADVTVAGEEYVAGVAANMSLGDLVTVLGRRADGLADLWNAWGRVRPLLGDSAPPGPGEPSA